MRFSRMRTNKPFFIMLGCMWAMVQTCIGRAQSPNEIGIQPVGLDGKVLNLDFETGDLRDWTIVSGSAFAQQPVEGDLVRARRADMQSNHQGKYWIGGFERTGDKPIGVMESAPFKITNTLASFLIGGGPNQQTRVDLVLKDTGTIIFSTTGDESETMERCVVDLYSHRGKTMFIRLVDEHKGHWGHLNFDDFRFHERRPQFPPRRNRPPPDQIQFAGLAGDDAASKMTVPPGFKVVCSAHEPDVRQPVAMAIDDRGRLWVVENFTYPRKSNLPMYVADPSKPPEFKGEDRILIFEDTDGDHKFDKRTVFTTGIQMASGIELGFGGVYVGAAPYLLFIPDKDHDDKPDGPPQILLDGWGSEDTHETLNSFKWGPDGWLYGCHGIFTHSNVGKPGTPKDAREKINAGIWRFHPTRKTFEVYAHGTSNPWGVDFNENGDCFLTCCVIPHLFHIIPGARYDRQAGAHFNPFTFDDIKTIAKHRHYLGDTPHGGNGRSDAAGGGHAHAGCMIYRGGIWPKQYHGKIFMNNIHGARLNVDEVTPSGSGYSGDRNPDFLLTNDSFSQIINLQYGPDGNVYMIDWYDRQQCHTTRPGDHDQTNGRVFKIVYQSEQPADDFTRATGITAAQLKSLRTLSTAELFKVCTHPNEFYFNHALRILMERKLDSAITLSDAEVSAVKQQERNARSQEHRFRLTAACYQVGLMTEQELIDSLLSSSKSTDQPADYASLGWSLRLLREQGVKPDRLEEGLVSLLAGEHTSAVRRIVTEHVLTMAPNQRAKILSQLVKHQADKNDHNLPLMYWYALEPVLDVDASAALAVAVASPIDVLARFSARKLGILATPESLSAVVNAIDKAPAAKQLELLIGLQQGLEGRRSINAPAGWSDLAAKLATSGSSQVKQLVGSLGVVFGDKSAMVAMRGLVSDINAPTAERAKALQSLVSNKDPDLISMLPVLLADSALRGQAIRASALFADSGLANSIVSSYAKLTSAEKRDAVNTLAARKEYASLLLKAISDKKIPSADVSADVVRQLRNLNDESINKLVVESWGIVRDSPADKAKLIDTWRAKLGRKPAAPTLADGKITDGPADPHLGRAVFQKTCAQCHKLFAEGGAVGPEITGANRTDLTYVLSNVLDPSAVMAKEYQPTLFELTDGRVVTGLIKSETNATCVVVTANETLTLAKDDIAGRKLSEKSMMPDDLWSKLSTFEVRSLVAYLGSTAQVPELATTDNANAFFNGKDLTGWWIEKESESAGGSKFENWSVENGEIVGKTTTGLKHNQFLKRALLVRDFRLSLDVKLLPNEQNSGIQFRSVPIAGGEMRGYQADVGKGWWGKLYEESGRTLLVPPIGNRRKPGFEKIVWNQTDAFIPKTDKHIGDSFVNQNEWNRYVIEAVGNKIKTSINGKTCVDIDDPDGAKEGVIAVQIHSGGPTEVRFKNFKFEVLTK